MSDLIEQMCDGKWHHIMILFDGKTGEKTFFIDKPMMAINIKTGLSITFTDHPCWDGCFGLEYLKERGDGR